jgi:hypothetical protein
VGVGVWWGVAGKVRVADGKGARGLGDLFMEISKSPEQKDGAPTQPISRKYPAPAWPAE